MNPSYLGVGMVVTKLFALVFSLGIVLFIIWAAKTLNKKQLQKLVVTLLLVGLAGMIASSVVFMGKGRSYADKDGERWGIGSMMNWGDCDKWDDSTTE